MKELLCDDKQLQSSRALLRRALALGGLPSVLALGHRLAHAEALAGAQADALVKNKPDVIVYRGTYPGWPWVTRTRKGRLLCVFRDDGVHGFSPTGKILWTWSYDLGKSWSAAQVVTDQPDVDDRNGAITGLPNGTLLVSFNTYTKDQVSCPMVICSGDDGASWEKPRVVAEQDARTRGAAIALSSGDLLLPIYKAPGNGSLAARSADGGKSWEITPVPGGDGFVGDEWVVVEVEEGRIVGMIRENGIRDGYFWKTESRDGGRTWDAAVKTNVRDARSTSPAHLDMHGATPVLTYADRRMVSVSMVTTDDADFLRWDLGRRLLCYQYRPDGDPIADASYPVSVAVGPGRRFIVDYEIRREGRWISGYFVDLPKDWL